MGMKKFHTTFHSNIYLKQEFRYILVQQKEIQKFKFLPLYLPILVKDIGIILCIISYGKFNIQN